MFYPLISVTGSRLAPADFDKGEDGFFTLQSVDFSNCESTILKMRKHHEVPVPDLC
jgi:hypothetical protein